MLLGIANSIVYAQKKIPKPEIGSVISNLQKALIKKYKYQNIRVYTFSGRLRIDISDIHVKSLPKNIRAERSKEIADFSRKFCDKTSEGKILLKQIMSITINHLLKPELGLSIYPNNIYDTYTF